MTLSLYVLRHAKAEDVAPSGGDAQRALKNRGRRAARQIGRLLARLDELPDRVLCSPALRARETAELAQVGAGWGARIELRPAIYEASPEALLRELASLEPEAARVLLVGHQPGLGMLLAELTGGEPDFPTAALARVDFECSRWSELGSRTGHLAWLVTPDVIAALRPRSRL